MSVLFDYYAEVKNVYNLVTDLAFQSEEIVNPSDDVFYQTFFNPGHNGTALWLDYYFYWVWKKTAGAAGAISWKVQYKPSGGAWTDLDTGNSDVAAPDSVIACVKGIKVASIAMPIEIRITGTDADATWRIDSIGGATYKCMMRAIGTA